MKENQIVFEREIENKIYNIRGSQVMLDSDLAELYQVETKVLNQSVKRNSERFPKEFMFQLKQEEYESLMLQIGTSKEILRSQSVTTKNEDLNNNSLRCQNGTSKKNSTLRSQIATTKETRGGRQYLPYVFTEQGVSMLSAVLRSKVAIQVSIKIINAFVSMRKILSSNQLIHTEIKTIKEDIIKNKIDTDEKFEILLNKFEKEQPKQGIFFDGQIFDAHSFLSKIIKEAENQIILIDNYIDETTLTILSKKEKQVKLKILTKNITNQLKLDIAKFEKQYGKVEIEKFNYSHDRFLIIDEEVYHIGASLKDLGAKWFAFSKLEEVGVEILNRIKQKSTNLDYIHHK